MIGELSGGPLDAATLPFKGCAALNLGLGRVQVARISVMGEYGYELNAPAQKCAGFTPGCALRGRHTDWCRWGFRTRERRVRRKTMASGHEYTSG